MIAAIYVRKSTEQNGVADDAKSVTRQIEHAKRYAERKGWAVDKAHVYVDDGISGAEFARRPGFLRLMNALKPHPTFQVLVMSEESRLGRESIETAYALKQLVQAGVRVFFYLEDRERTLDSPTDKIMLSLTAFADELEREKARQRTYDAMIRKARAGHVTGGRVFGYDNVRVDGHVERRINETEAAVVRRIFQSCADGRGLSAITKSLNEDGAVAPRAQQRRPTGWAPSSVREVLHRPLYRGVIVWNQTKKRDRWGQHRQTARPESDWLTVDAPALRIVPEDLWQAAHARQTRDRAKYLRATSGRLWGRPRDAESKYLLSGFTRCGCCNGSLCIRSGSHGRGRAHFYACMSYHRRGRAICRNSIEVPMRPLDVAVLEALERYVLDPEVIALVVDDTVAALTTPRGRDETDSLRAELSTLQVEIARLSDAVAAGGHLSSLVDALKARESRQVTVRATLDTVMAIEGRIPPSHVDAQRLVLEKLADWRGLLDRNVAQTRQILRKLLEGPIVCTPLDDGRKGVGFRADVSLGPVISGVLGVPTSVASPPGIRW